MGFAKAENKSHQPNAKTTVNTATGEKGISMPAVPVLQNQPAQLQSANDENPGQAQTPVELQRQYADKDHRENTQPFQLAAQSAPNNTGLPDDLKKGIESLSGFDVGDVKVHYNSPKPAQLQAFAYAQGTDIHVAPGQEKHVPHEAWHVVQQKQGRVQPTMQLKEGVPVNDDPALEQEATAMGNQAVQEKFDPASFTRPVQLKSDFGSAGVVQRKVENEKIDDPTSEDGAAALEFLDHVNGLAQEARQFIIDVPSLGPYAGLDGHTALWKEKWDSHLTGGMPKLLAATFGYVVESLVSNFIGPYHPVAPTGYTIYYQVISGGTRPDLVLRRSGSGEDIVWADLTAKNSGGHIFLKDSWDKKVARYAEITYPSIDGSTLLLMRGNRNNTTKLSQEEFEKKKKEIDLAYALRKAQWSEFGKQLRFSNFHIDIPLSILKDNPQIKQEVIISALQTIFKESTIDIGIVPSILVAMGVDPAPWGFTTGTSATRAAGEAWLTDRDPTAPNLTPSFAPKDKEEKKTPSKSTVDEEGTHEEMETEHNK